MRPKWKPGTKVVCVLKFQPFDAQGFSNIEGINVPKLGEIVTIHSPCSRYEDAFDIREYLFDVISGTSESFIHRHFRKLIEIDSEVSEALSELTVQERSDIVLEPVNN